LRAAFAMMATSGAGVIVVGFPRKYCVGSARPRYRYPVCAGEMAALHVGLPGFAVRLRCLYQAVARLWWGPGLLAIGLQVGLQVVF